MQVAGFSGGKDSTAMVLRMAELGEDFELLFNPTGSELPELLDHLALVTRMTGKRLNVTNPGFSLVSRIRRYKSTPSHRMRWCTRELKIEPTKAWLLAHQGTVLCIGLRADEEREGAPGLYGDGIKYRLPFREWGWGLDQVQDYLDARGVKVPQRGVQLMAARLQARVVSGRSACPECFPLAARTKGRVGLLRGAGNSIVPEVAAIFIRSFLEAEADLCSS